MNKKKKEIIILCVSSVILVVISIFYFSNLKDDNLNLLLTPEKYDDGSEEIVNIDNDETVEKNDDTSVTVEEEKNNSSDTNIEVNNSLSTNVTKDSDTSNKKNEYKQNEYVGSGKLDNSEVSDNKYDNGGSSIDETPITESKDDVGQNQYTEEDVVAYFENIETEVTSGTFDNFKSKCKEYFITTVDFIFYDKEIKGYTFSELTDVAKVKIVGLALKIDSKIEEKIPNYKESISSTSGRIYTNIKEKLVTLYMDISTDICDNNPDGCDKAKEIFSSVKESCKIGWTFIKELAISGFSKLKDWYEIYSGK